MLSASRSICRSISSLISARLIEGRGFQNLSTDWKLGAGQQHITREILLSLYRYIYPLAWKSHQSQGKSMMDPHLHLDCNYGGDLPHYRGAPESIETPMQFSAPGGHLSFVCLLETNPSGIVIVAAVVYMDMP